MENINSVLLKAKKYLINNSIKSANIDSEILMCSVLKKSREYLILNTLDKIDDDKINIFNQLIERRKKQEPIAYDVDVPSKSGSEHVQESLFNMANEKDY